MYGAGIWTQFKICFQESSTANYWTIKETAETQKRLVAGCGYGESNRFQTVEPQTKAVLQSAD